MAVANTAEERVKKEKAWQKKGKGGAGDTFQSPQSTGDTRPATIFGTRF
jgi:hypothetical protein